MHNVLFSMADCCNQQSSCGFFAKWMSCWAGLGANIQIGIQLALLLLVFFVLTKLFACKAQTSCTQGCKCGCGESCNCKNDTE